jgi:hypothetical protein
VYYVHPVGIAAAALVAEPCGVHRSFASRALYGSSLALLAFAGSALVACSDDDTSSSSGAGGAASTSSSSGTGASTG